MPPNRLTEDDLQSLLEHVKVQVDPTFNKALQAELRARARELRLASETSRKLSMTNAPISRPAASTYDHTQEESRGWGSGWLKPINMLSSVVLAAAALALVFLVLVRPALDKRANELDMTPTSSMQPTPGSAQVTSTSAETLTAQPGDTTTPLPAATELPVATTEPTAIPSAIPTPVVTVTCSWTQVSGHIEQTASYVRLTVSLSSPTIQEIGSAVAPVQPDGSYNISVTYSALPAGTHLIGGYGEWDGASWLRPATMFGGDCSPEGAVPVPPPTPTPSPITLQTVQFWPDTTSMDRHLTVDFGARISFESTLTTRARLLAFFIYRGDAIPDNSVCLRQQIPGRGAEKLWSTGMYTELAPGKRDFEQSYTYDEDAPDDATHLVMWLMLIETDNNAITCWQNAIELLPVSP